MCRAHLSGPTAEGLSRLLFGYSSDGDPDSLAQTQAPVDLPFRWVISKNEVDEAAVARRFANGRTAYGRNRAMTLRKQNRWALPGLRMLKPEGIDDTRRPMQVIEHVRNGLVELAAVFVS